MDLVLVLSFINTSKGTSKIKTEEKGSEHANNVPVCVCVKKLIYEQFFPHDE